MVTGMAEYIERVAAHDAVVDAIWHGKKSMYDVASAINSVPNADVAPVRHGRWLDVQETDMYVPDLKLTATKTAETCSVCKARIGFIGAKLYLFDSICPNCGARMDLEEV